MNHEELNEVLQALTENQYYFDKLYCRTTPINDTVNLAIKELWQNNYRYWEIGKRLSVPNEYVKHYLMTIGINYKTRCLKNEHILESLSSEFIPFDGAAQLRLTKELYNLDDNIVAEATGIPKTIYKRILSGRQLPTSVQINNLSSVLNINMENWMQLSMDVNAIISNHISDDLPRTGIIRAENLGLYNKQYLVRHVLAFARLANRLSIRDVAKHLHILDWQYLDIEMCNSAPTKQQAVELGYLLGIEKWVDVYLCKPCPANYEYIFRVSAALEKDKQHKRFRGDLAWKFDELIKSNEYVAEQTIKKYEQEGDTL